MASRYRFARAEVRPDGRQLLIEGREAAIGARAFDLLVALLERRERLVTKDELLEVVWPGLVVEENNLAVQVSTLRKLLGPQAIATVPGRGYRFVASLDVTPTVEAASPDAAPNAEAVPVAAAPPAAHARGALPQSDPRRDEALGAAPERAPPLVGRAEELDVLQRLLADHALVTITGSGGIGKTHLASTLAAARRPDAARAVAWVDFTPLSDATLIVGTIAAAAAATLDDGHAPLDALVAALRKRSLLIVLDNCEHLVEGVAAVAQALLTGTRDVRVLATSQVPLKIAGEHVFRLGPLALPPHSAAVPTAREAIEHGAVALFVARASAADRRFQLTDEVVSAVIDICNRLDGIPLAIELVAARLPSLGLPALAANLDRRFELLTTGHRTAPARQQTLRAAMDWTYGLLDESEQFVFRRLGVFAGGFSLAALRAVARSESVDEWDAIDALSGLVDKSLVVADHGDAPRYRLLETARAYALEKLGAAGELDRAQRAHAVYFLRFFEDAHESWWQVNDVQWRAHTDPELDNLRAALDWASGTGKNDEVLARLAGASLPMWLDRGAQRQHEGRRHVGAALAVGAGTDGSAIEGRLRFAWALLLPLSQADKIGASLERAVDLFRRNGATRALCHALIDHSRMLTRMERPAEAERALQEAADLLARDDVPQLRGWHHLAEAFRRQMSGDLRGARSAFEAGGAALDAHGAGRLALHAWSDVADASWALGDLDRAASEFRAAIERVRRSPYPDPSALGVPLSNLAGVMVEQGRLEEATAIAREALRALREADKGWTFLDTLALRLVSIGRDADAARVEGFVSAVYESSGQQREPNEARMNARALSRLRERLPEAELQALRRAGATLSEDEAFALAL